MKSEALEAYGRSNGPLDFPEGIARKRDHVLRVVELSAAWFVKGMDAELLNFCALHHDDGRTRQYLEQGGKLDDRVKSHAEYGVEQLTDFIQENDFPMDREVGICIEVMRYHGAPDLSKVNVSSIALPYVQAVRNADRLDNAINAPSYLLINVKNDEKGYIAANPEEDQSKISDEVWKHFASGELFDREKLCKTYADYVLFASLLAVDAVKKFGEIATKHFFEPKNGYERAIDGYYYVFKEVMPKYAHCAFAVLLENMGH